MNSTDAFQEHVKQQKLDTKQYDVIYMKFKSRQNYSMAMESEVADGVGRDCRERSVRNFCIVIVVWVTLAYAH